MTMVIPVSGETVPDPSSGVVEERVALFESVPEADLQQLIERGTASGSLTIDEVLSVLAVRGQHETDPAEIKAFFSERKISIDDASRKRPAVLYAFDVLELERIDRRDLPLMQRKEAVQKAVARAERILPVGHFDQDGVSLFQLAAKNGIEGIVAKRADSPYRAGHRRRACQVA